jgi:hypothetical protein
MYSFVGFIISVSCDVKKLDVSSISDSRKFINSLPMTQSECPLENGFKEANTS